MQYLPLSILIDLIFILTYVSDASMLHSAIQDMYQHHSNYL